jgi:hypothetical protein
MAGALAVGTLLVTTVAVALVSEVFIESLTEASAQLGLLPPLWDSSSLHSWERLRKWLRHSRQRARTGLT